MQQGIQLKAWSSDGDSWRGTEAGKNMGNLDYSYNYDKDSQTEVQDEELDMMNFSEKEATSETETEPPKPVVKITAEKENQKQLKAFSQLNYLAILFALLAEFLLLAICIDFEFGSRSTKIVEV
ncbi:Hypothetical predicted protein [Cloeon dipterum]|nr:Hypothetical predicted protein [Cloeon dipterum]